MAERTGMGIGGIRLGSLAWCAMGAGMLAAMLAAAPEPDPVPKRWQLEVSAGQLRVATVRTDAGATAYLYFTYSTVNNTGEELEFVPSFELATDDGEVLASGVDIPAQVTREILASLEQPCLEDQIAVIGPIGPGPENAKHGLVIWPLTDADGDEIRVFGAGFSGESETLELTDPRTGEARRLVFRKTLMMRFQLPGMVDPASRRSEPFELVEQRWIMR